MGTETIQFAFLPVNYKGENWDRPFKLSEMPLKERPAERFQSFGAGALSTIEILAVIVGGQHQYTVAQQLMVTYQSLGNIRKASICEMADIHNVGMATATRIKAALELGSRMITEFDTERPQIHSPADAANFLMADMMHLDHEEMRLVLLDTKNRILATPTLYMGNVNTSIIRVGEIFGAALRINAPGIIIVHNHPSGDPTPSPEDVRVTERIVEAGKLMDVDVLDHLVIGHSRYVSMKERGLGF